MWLPSVLARPPNNVQLYNRLTGDSTTASVVRVVIALDDLRASCCEFWPFGQIPRFIVLFDPRDQSAATLHAEMDTEEEHIALIRIPRSQLAAFLCHYVQHPSFHVLHLSLHLAQPAASALKFFTNVAFPEFPRGMYFLSNVRWAFVSQQPVGGESQGWAVETTIFGPSQTDLIECEPYLERLLRIHR